MRLKAHNGCEFLSEIGIQAIGCVDDPTTSLELVDCRPERRIGIEAPKEKGLHFYGVSFVGRPERSVKFPEETVLRTAHRVDVV